WDLPSCPRSIPPLPTAAPRARSSRSSFPATSRRVFWPTPSRARWPRPIGRSKSSSSTTDRRTRPRRSPPATRRSATSSRTTRACVMFRRSALDAIGGFDTRVDACADYEMYLRVSRAFPVAFHGQMVAEYRRHGDNMSLDAPRMLRDLCAIMRRQRRLLRGDEARLDAWRQGRRNIGEYYGDHVANRNRERVRERMEWGSVVADTLT